MISAAPGHVLIGADFSAIESRVLAWVAGEAVETRQLIDASTRQTIRATSLIAKQLAGSSVCQPALHKGQRTDVGKICDLAFGYMGGIAAWRKFEPDRFTDDEVKSLTSSGELHIRRSAILVRRRSRCL